MLSPEIIHLEPGYTPEFPLESHPSQRTYVVREEYFTGSLYANKLTLITDHDIHGDHFRVPLVDVHAGLLEFIVETVGFGKVRVPESLAMPYEIARLMLVMRKDDPSVVGVVITVKDVPSSVWISRNPSKGGRLEERNDKDEVVHHNP